MFDVRRKDRLYWENVGEKAEEHGADFGELDNWKWGDYCICGRSGTWLMVGGGRDTIAKYRRAMYDGNPQNAEFVRVARSKNDVRLRIVKDEVLERYDWAHRGGIRSSGCHRKEWDQLETHRH